MKKFLIPCLLIMCMIFSAAPVSAYPSLTDHPTVTVLKFKNKAAKDKKIGNVLTFEDASIISDFMVTALIVPKQTKGLFHISNIEDAAGAGEIQEHNWGGMVDISNAPKMGKQSAIHYYISGSLTGLNAKESGGTAESDLVPGTNIGLGKDTGAKKKTVTANVSVKITNVETNEIICSAQGVGRSSVANVVFNLNKNGEEVYESDNSDSSNNPDIGTAKSVKVFNHKFTIGTAEYTGEQVQNAIQKAVWDALTNKKYGIIAQINGTATSGGNIFK